MTTDPVLPGVRSATGQARASAGDRGVSVAAGDVGGQAFSEG
ncbi:hypothetical protein ACU610_03020 [Geodermatophilus sp. URMC 61]